MRTVEQKIACAEKYSFECKELLCGCHVIEDLLGSLRTAIEASQKVMINIGIAAECERCEKSEGGSCCGAGLEEYYDWPLLLINLLLGVKLPQTRRDEKSCFFLGDRGCLLLARHVLCVNYLCKKITDRVDPGGLQILREEEGKELKIVFLLCERIKRELRGCKEDTC